MKLAGEAAVVKRTARKGPAANADDEVAVEEPLEIRVAGDLVYTTMRTPGHDRQLALGFLYAEGIIGSLSDVGSIAHCGRPQDPDFGNVIEVLPGAGVALAPERVASARRGTLTTSACGVCGRLSIEDLLARCSPLVDDSAIEAAVLSRLATALRDEQPVFARTGGVHAAALFDVLGGSGIVCEDIGRHNAVDKVVGSLVLSGGLPAAARALIVSGRASFEIIQKAAAARIPIVASVSAASSLAIDLADQMNLTLASFVRNGSMTVYTHPERLRWRERIQ
jgi:FdhD protein